MNLSDISTTLYDAIMYIVLAFLIFYIGKAVYQLVNKDFDIKNELVEKDNLAFSIAHVGYFTGLLIAIGGAIVGPSHGLFADMIDILVYGLLAVLLLNISIWVNDKFILRNFSIKKEIIEDQNEGTGIIEGAVAVASGLIIFGAISGEAESHAWFHGILTSVLFWAVGLVALYITSLVYQKITPYDIHSEIEKDNVAVGLGYAGAIIAIANLIRFALMGNFESWAISFSEIGFELAIGIVLLPVMRLLTDKILLPGQRLTDEIVNQEKPNIGAALIEAFAYIGGSVLITWCL